MYMAELRGKLSEKVEKSEDILTSNVFSFFKYSNRQVFLKGFIDKFLGNTGVVVSNGDVEMAEFQFWPKYADRTEPDLVIIVGKYYILIEAKYHSSFEWTKEVEKNQLLRELRGGLSEARNLSKEFCLIALTADYTCKPQNFQYIEQEELVPINFKWINWQQIHDYLLERLEHSSLTLTDQIFCKDLCGLLDKKNLRPYRDITKVLSNRTIVKEHLKIFLESETIKSRGDFIGFELVLSELDKIQKVPKDLFLQGRILFRSLLSGVNLQKSNDFIFFGTLRRSYGEERNYHTN